MPGRIIETPALVTEYQPDELIRFRRASGPIRPEGSYRYQAVPEGTRLTFALEAPLSGGWRALTPVVALLVRLVVRLSRKDFRRLKALLETTAPQAADAVAASNESALPR